MSSREQQRGQVITQILEGRLPVRDAARLLGHSMSKQYLPLDLAEFTFRHNHRKDLNLFDATVAGC